MFLCKWRARKQISLHRDNKVVLYCIVLYIYFAFCSNRWQYTKPLLKVKHQLTNQFPEYIGWLCLGEVWRDWGRILIWLSHDAWHRQQLSEVILLLQRRERVYGSVSHKDDAVRFCSSIIVHNNSHRILLSVFTKKHPNHGPTHSPPSSCSCTPPTHTHNHPQTHTWSLLSLLLFLSNIP